jgi:hypothetical protein
MDIEGRPTRSWPIPLEQAAPVLSYVLGIIYGLRRVGKFALPDRIHDPLEVDRVLVQPVGKNVLDLIRPLLRGHGMEFV